MPLTVHLHPLSSYCHKVLIALYENEVDFKAEIVDFGDANSAAALRDKWPLGKIPLLEDSTHNRIVPETTIIIEYVQQYYPGKIALLPQDRELCLEARLWDRFFDLYISTPMQQFVVDWMRPENEKDPVSIKAARQTLDVAYGMANTQLAKRPWAAGSTFTIADCAAAPALFYSSIVHPIDPRHSHLLEYFEGLLLRQSVRRTLVEAQPYFSMYPFVDSMPQRFKDMQLT